ncbi:MAG: YceD family protein, partial [Gammaproteobacteria bacterium]
LIVTGSEVSLLDLVEDELLLSLPIVAKHEEECSEILQQHKEDDEAQHDTYRPFAALKDLMN